MKWDGMLYDPLRQFISDKEFVKIYIEAKVGPHFPKTLAVLRTPDEIREFQFPPRCIVKPSHASGVAVRLDGTKAIPRVKIESFLNADLYARTRESNYRYLEKKVLVEELVDFGQGELVDYKVHCFFGKPQHIHVVRGRTTSYSENYYSTSWRRLPIVFLRRSGPAASHPDDPCPGNLDEMLALAARLSADFSCIRVDLYTDGRRILVGELTNLAANAARPLKDPEVELKLGRIFLGEDADDVFFPDEASEPRTTGW